MARKLLDRNNLISNVNYNLEAGFGSINETLKKAREQDPSVNMVDVENLKIQWFKLLHSPISNIWIPSWYNELVPFTKFHTYFWNKSNQSKKVMRGMACASIITVFLMVLNSQQHLFSIQSAIPRARRPSCDCFLRQRSGLSFRQTHTRMAKNTFSKNIFLQSWTTILAAVSRCFPR